MPGPETVDVDVVILTDPIQAPPNGFQLISGIVSNDNILNFRNRGHPGFIVKFNIVDTTGAGFQFLPNPAQALWVQPLFAPAQGCPNAQCSWEQFEAQAVTGNGQMLIVRNRNEFTQRFGYVLNVQAPGGAQPGVTQVIDPIGNNQNGPQ